MVRTFFHFFHCLNRQSNCEGGMFTQLTYHSDIALHYFHQALTDSQAQPGAPKAPRGGGLGLIEIGEQIGQCLGCHTDTVITDRKDQLIRGGISQFHSYFHPAPLLLSCATELDGIAHQIVEHLA